MSVGTPVARGEVIALICHRTGTGSMGLGTNITHLTVDLTNKVICEWDQPKGERSCYNVSGLIVVPRPSAPGLKSSIPPHGHTANDILESLLPRPDEYTVDINPDAAAVHMDGVHSSYSLILDLTTKTLVEKRSLCKPCAVRLMQQKVSSCEPERSGNRR
jgi:hypothetical protein